MPESPLHAPLLSWYVEHARDLPWRRPGTSPWAVLVSEVMLQQTPVARVLPAYDEWLRRWPFPADLARAEPGEAVRRWGTLGYPRRALRLHAAATAIVDRHGGEVPSTYDALLALPGVGDYTAAAVAAFAFGAGTVVLDTNVRRVLERVVGGKAAVGPAPTAAERARAAALLPDGGLAPRWSVAVMELGALVCRPANPRCSPCPLAPQCRWQSAGRPASLLPQHRQAWVGTDRQARGRLLAVLRAAQVPVAAADLEGAWPEPEQRARALASLVADGLAERGVDGCLRLPRGGGR